MIRPITALTALLACGAGLYLYQSKHRAHLLDQQIETTVHQADTVRERIRMLHAEWTLLNRPDRLQRLADQFLSLEPTKPGQFVTEADLASRLPPVQLPAATPPPADGAPGVTEPGVTEPGAGVPVAALTPAVSAGAASGASSDASTSRGTSAGMGASQGAATASAATAQVAATPLPPQKHPQPVRLAATRPVPPHRMGAARQDPPPPGAAAWQQQHVATAIPPAPRPWSAPPARYQAARAPVAAYQPPRYLPARYRPPAYQSPAYRPPAYRPPAYRPPAYHPPAYHPSVYGAAYRAPAPVPAGSLLGMAQGGGAAPPPPAPMPVVGSSGG
jgi:hypothetical protein